MNGHEPLNSDPDRDERSIRERLARSIETLRGSTVPDAPYRPREHGHVVGDRTFEDREVERYWLNAPFSYAAVTHDDDLNQYHYHVVEPELDRFERDLLEMLYDDVRVSLLYTTRDGDPQEVLRSALRDRLERYGVEVAADGFYRLYYYLYRRFQGFGALDPLMYDPQIEDISCDGYGIPLYAYHDTYQDIETNVSFERTELDSYIVRMAQQAGRHISVGNPIVETTLRDGSRAELALGEEVTPHGSAFTVRKYSDEPFTPIDLIDVGTYSIEQMAYLWLAIEHNRNLVFAGGTASGKTTSMNAISMFIPPRSKLITIEDTRELSLHHDNWLSCVTRERLDEGADVTMYDLLRSALRHRPEYIIVGEVRGEEAITLFQAMNTGHTTLSTMHADSVQTVINRLENEPINVPRPMVQSLDVLCVQTLARVGNERIRRAEAIAEIEGIDQRTGELDYTDAYRWDSSTDRFEEGSKTLTEEIRAERGWSKSDLLRELNRRRQFLEFLHERNISQYQQFTAMVDRYYAAPDEVMERIENAESDPNPTGTPDPETASDGKGRRGG
ncbi:MAG: type II/IV secretion system ATPase subunit [Natronomonas sp.]|uniref:type II/IV secretion system ATPase subunit n=1 Tax=Natronomonas sp. TaxID=2184060 RepID=UPI002870216B|nr:type II/IV secretion system ATPase subunit [Natronomonas sp.]MDR9430868.1 type II/IV secretion system ATPase subunit [Natronomonas sp.]